MSTLSNHRSLFTVPLYSKRIVEDIAVDYFAVQIVANFGAVGKVGMRTSSLF